MHYKNMTTELELIKLIPKTGAETNAPQRQYTIRHNHSYIYLFVC